MSGNKKEILDELIANCLDHYEKANDYVPEEIEAEYMEMLKILASSNLNWVNSGNHLKTEIITNEGHKFTVLISHGMNQYNVSNLNNFSQVPSFISIYNEEMERIGLLAISFGDITRFGIPKDNILKFVEACNKELVKIQKSNRNFKKLIGLKEPEEVIEESLLNEEYFKKVSKLDFINKFYKQVLKGQSKYCINLDDYSKIEKPITEAFKTLLTSNTWHIVEENFIYKSLKGKKPVLTTDKTKNLPIYNFEIHINNLYDFDFDDISIKLHCGDGYLSSYNMSIQELYSLGIPKDMLVEFFSKQQKLILDVQQYKKTQPEYEWTEKGVIEIPKEDIIEESVEDNKKYVDYVATHNVMCGYDSEYKPGEKEAKIKKIADIISCFAKSSKKVMDWFTTEGEPIDRYTPSDEKVYLLKIYSSEYDKHTFSVYFSPIRKTFVSNLGIEEYCSFDMSAGDLKRLVDITDEEIYKLIEENKNSPQTLYFQGIRQRRKDAEKEVIEESVESIEKVRDNEMIWKHIEEKNNNLNEESKNYFYDIIEAIRNSDDIFVGYVDEDGKPFSEDYKPRFPEDMYSAIIVKFKLDNRYNKKAMIEFNPHYKDFSYVILPYKHEVVGMNNITSTMLEKIYNIPTEFIKDCIQLAYKSEKYKKDQKYQEYTKSNKEIPLEEADELSSMEDIEKEVSSWDETKEEEALLNKVGELIPTAQYRLGKYYINEKCRAIIDMVNHPQNWKVVQRDGGSHFLKYKINGYDGLQYFTLTYDTGSVDEVISNTYISYILSLVVSSNSNSVSTINIAHLTFSELLNILHLPVDICRLLHDENIKYSQMFRKHIDSNYNVIEESFDPKKRYEEIVNPEGLTEEKIRELENTDEDEESENTFDDVNNYWWELENNVPERKRIISEIRNGEVKISVLKDTIFVDFKDKEQMQIVPSDYETNYGEWYISFRYMYNIFEGKYSTTDLIYVFGINPKIVGEALSNIKTLIKTHYNDVIEESVETNVDLDNVNVRQLIKDTLKIGDKIKLTEKRLVLFSKLCKKYFDEKIVDWIVDIASRKINDRIHVAYLENLMEYMKVLTDIANHKEERLVNDNEYGETYIELGDVGARIYRSSVHSNELFIRIGTVAFDPTIKEAVELLNIKPETISKLINLTPEYNISYSQRKEKEVDKDVIEESVEDSDNIEE